MSEMESLASAKRARSSARGWLTRAVKSLEHMLSIKKCDKFDIEEGLKTLNERYAALKEAQQAVESLLPDEELDADIEEACLIFEHVADVRKTASRKLSSIGNEDLSETGSVSVHQTAKLPKLELPTFNGDVTQWPSFWDKFQATVHNSNLPDVTKFTYLQSLLVGDAKKAVEGLSLTSAHYDIACSLLRKRFGRREKVVFSHIQGLLNVSSSGKGSRLSQLKSLQDQILVHVRSLEALEVSGSTYGIVLTPLVLSRLPSDVRLEWARKGEEKEGDLQYLLEFLDAEVYRRERAEPLQVLPVEKTTESKRHKLPANVTSASALKASSSFVCGFCSKNHPSAKCFSLSRLSTQEKQRRIRDAGLCFKCLGTGHVAKRCSAMCFKCQGNHHSIICTGANKNKKPETEVLNAADVQRVNKEPSHDVNDDTSSKESESHVGVAGTAKCKMKSSVLQVVKVNVTCAKGSREVALMLDSGADRTYVSCKFVKELCPKWAGSVDLKYSVFGGGHSSTLTRNVYEFDVSGMNELKTNVTLRAVEVPVICAPLSRPNLNEHVLSKFGEMELADQLVSSDCVEIDVLVGMDHYWQLVKGNVRRIPNSNLVAQETIFGWVLSGAFDGVSNTALSRQFLCLQDLSENTVRRFWELDSIGVSSNHCIAPQDKVLEEFNKTVQYKDGRYEVALPWKKGEKVAELLNNKKEAQIRLQGLSRKLDKDPFLKSCYNNALSEMEVNGVIEEVPASEIDPDPSPVFYLPHRPVVKEASSTTKVRPVFDASAAGVNSVSLNDCLETGPSLIPSLVEILIRFRRWQVAMTADLTKAFLQIKLRKPDQDVHRFLWEVDGAVRVMRFLRVTFGNKASPFLLNATIRYHLSKYPPDKVIQELQENMYVDDWLSGADSEAEVCDMFTEAKAVMAHAGMTLAKWKSNSKYIMEKMYGDAFESDEVQVESKVLGVKWNPDTDSFSFDGINLPSNLVITKRVVLSCIARIFDPVGFLTPFTIAAKVLFQKLWQMGLSWDEEVLDEVGSCFFKWLNGLTSLKSLQIFRCYSSTAWSQSQVIELHSFGDASELAYGAVVFLLFRKSNGQVSTSLVTSKARVAPLKKITLPRLELLGSLLAARLLVFVRKALRLSSNVVYRCWTDSTVALAWIKGNPWQWKQFVANRVSEIQELSDPSCWYHCPGSHNPADLITRGVSAETLLGSSLWWKGPTWLCGPVEEYPNSRVVADFKSEMTLSLASEVVLPSKSESAQVELFDVSRWGRFLKAMRVVAFVLRFVFNCRHSKEERKSGELSYNDLCAAKLVLFRQVQGLHFQTEVKLLKQNKNVPKSSVLFKLSPFLDEDGLLRVRGRLQTSRLSFEEKHPIILPKDYTSKLLVRFQHGLLKHAGVETLLSSLRGSYWIIGLRRLAKSVKKECLVCARLDSKACSEVAPPLPELRVSEAPPFTVTGVDFAGPLYCVNDPGKKFYVCLFTCAVVRAVHLELTESLSANDFVMAFKRFSSRRGLPSVMYSDNAKTFKAAEVQLLAHYGPSGPSWKYIAPLSPWWGGWWERLVRSVKAGLKKSLGKACLTRTELETTLLEVENCINSRPLTFVSDETQSKNPLTPNHFLTSRGSNFLGSVVEDVANINAKVLDLRMRTCQSRLNDFWEVWKLEYLRSLSPVVRKSKGQCPLKVGNIVLIQDDRVPRLQWPLGKVTRLLPGKDNKVRCVELLTSKGTKVRSIQKLHHLEFVADQPRDIDVSQRVDLATASPQKVDVSSLRRSKRVTKPVQRLGVI